MKVAGINKICVVGAGAMGSQIALSCALAGYEVKCTSRTLATLKKADEFTDTYLAGRVTSGKLTQEAATQARQNIAFIPSLKEAAAGADWVFEVVAEDLKLKRDLFAQLDKICPPHAILATNSSSIVSSRIADATGRPDKVLNVHFFVPALVMKLVEVVQGPHVSDETVKIAMEVSKSMGKVPVLVKKEIHGFLVNRIWWHIRDEALSLYDTGVASIEDIDAAVVNGLGHPRGPFTLMDIIGIDVEYNIIMGHYRDTGNPADKPSPLLVEKYAKGEWGNKTGRGFYEKSTNNK